MELLLNRRYKGSLYTIGDLYVNGVKVCESIEDTDRKLSNSMPEAEIIRKKVPNQTAIPTGKYHISMDTVSPKFSSKIWAQPYGGKIPRLLSVKGFSGVLIHPGTDQNSTSGCIITGWNKVKGKVVDSQKAFRMLMDNYLVSAYKKGEDITIEIR